MMVITCNESIHLIWYCLNIINSSTYSIHFIHLHINSIFTLRIQCNDIISGTTAYINNALRHNIIWPAYDLLSVCIQGI